MAASIFRTALIMSAPTRALLYLAGAVVGQPLLDGVEELHGLLPLGLAEDLAHVHRGVRDGPPVGAGELVDLHLLAAQHVEEVGEDLAHRLAALGLDGAAPIDDDLL